MNYDPLPTPIRTKWRLPVKRQTFPLHKGTRASQGQSYRFSFSFALLFRTGTARTHVVVHRGWAYNVIPTARTPPEFPRNQPPPYYAQHELARQHFSTTGPLLHTSRSLSLSEGRPAGNCTDRNWCGMRDQAGALRAFDMESHGAAQKTAETRPDSIQFLSTRRT